MYRSNWIFLAFLGLVWPNICVFLLCKSFLSKRAKQCRIYSAVEVDKSPAFTAKCPMCV